MTGPKLSATRATKSSTIALVGVGVLLLGLAAVPLWSDTDVERLMIDIFLYAALAALWNFLAGFAGLVSVGQQAYVGIGGYGLIALSAKAGVPPLYCVPIMGLVAAAFAVPVAGVVFRLRGAYFAIGSWVVAEVLRLSAKLITPLGGGSGMSLPVRVLTSVGRRPADRFAVEYWVSLALLIAILGAIFLTLRSRLGLALTAIRDNELTARSSGVSVARTKLIVYVVAAAGAAMVGALIFLQKLRVTSDSAFSVNDWTALVIFMVVIGGLGTFEGPIIGTLVFFALRETLSDLGPLYLIALGAVAIGVMLIEPKGVWGFVRKRWRAQLLPLQLRVVGAGER